MADNKTFQSGTLATLPAATVVATDEITGVDYQRVKLTDGTADSTTVVATGNGTHTNALRVTLASDGTGTVVVTDGGSTISVDDGGGTLTVDGTVTIQDGGNTITVDNGGTFAVQADTELTTADLDTGAGTDTRAVVGLVLAKSGGAANVSSTDPIPVTVISDATSTEYAEDAAHSSGDKGRMMLAVRKDTATALAGTDGDYAPLEVDASGRVHVNVGNTVAVSQGLTTTGGATIHEAVSGASTNATNVKASAGNVYQIVVFNTNASARYLKFHNTSGTPTAGTSVVFSVLVPGSNTGAGVVIPIPMGMSFSSGIAYTTVTGAANSDSAAVAANDLIINILYN